MVSYICLVDAACQVGATGSTMVSYISLVDAAYKVGATGSTMVSYISLVDAACQVGATGSTMVSYILPGAIYYKLHPTGGVRKWLAALLFCLGCIIMPVATTYIILGQSSGGMVDD